MTNDIDDEMRKALARYNGPVTRCHPGNARGKRVKPLPPVRGQRVNVQHERNHLRDDDVAKWLSGYDAAVMTVEQERSRRRNERAERVQHEHRRKHSAARWERLRVKNQQARLHVEPAAGGKWAVVDGANKVLAQFVTNANCAPRLPC
jgi:hypothetical protein